MTEIPNAAPQAPAVTGNAQPAAPLPPEQPAAAAIPQPCIRRLEPDYKQPCPNEASGGLRVTLKPAPAVTKRWGLHSMLTFVMDLPVCASCFPKVNIMEVTDKDLRSTLSKAAQRMNNGVLVDWSQTAIEHLPFDDPYYVALRDHMAKQNAANDSQPSAGQGAGDGVE